jgi:hypothetical protein
MSIRSFKSQSFFNASDLAAKTAPKTMTANSRILVKKRRIFYKKLLKALNEIH